MKRHVLVLAAGLSLAAAGCGERSDTASAPVGPAPTLKTAAAEPVPNATIHEIMSMQAEPAADAIWESVKTISDSTGVHDYRPRTDAEWAAIEQAANTLIGVAAMIPQEGRQLIRPGMTMEEGGTLDAAGIQAKIASNRALFAEKAKGLDAAARVTLAAIRARDVEALLDAGGPLDEACEACHLEFYYPPAPGR
jgi:hypothetical protein